MTATMQPSPWRQNPDERLARRRQRRDTAQRLLVGYLDAVAGALEQEGMRVIGRRANTSPALEGSLSIVPGHALVPGESSTLELAWAEDTGWSIAHRLIGTTTTPWRYLHMELVPAPSTVAQFVLAVLCNEDDSGMLYPAQFRFRAQPLQPVIDALARRTAPTAGARATRNGCPADAPASAVAPAQRGVG
jgi:uncharacterized protein DUF6292